MAENIASRVAMLDTQLPRLNVLQYKQQVDVFVNISTQAFAKR